MNKEMIRVVQYGCCLLYTSCDACPSAFCGAQEEPSNAFVESNREQWEMLAKKEPQALRSKLASALIGTATLHEAQAKTLELLDAGAVSYTHLDVYKRQDLLWFRWWLAVHQAAREALQEGRSQRPPK